MSGQFAIRAALRAQLLTASGLPASRAWENRDFLPVEGTAYLSENLMVSAERPVSSGQIEQTGIYQVRLHYPGGAGTKAAEEVADAIVAVFPPAGSYGGIVRTDRSFRSAGYRDGLWWVLPVSIRWRAYSTF